MPIDVIYYYQKSEIILSSIGNIFIKYKKCRYKRHEILFSKSRHIATKIEKYWKDKRYQCQRYEILQSKKLHIGVKDLKNDATCIKRPEI